MSDPKILLTGDAPELRSLLPVNPGKEGYGLAFFSSPEAMARNALQFDGSTAWHGETWRNHDDSFYGADMAKACAMAQAGWPEGAERVSRLRDKISAKNPQRRQYAKWGVAGSYSSVPRFLAGNPCNMRQIDSAKARRKVVLTLVSDMSCPWFIDHRSITNRAAVTAAIVDAIQAAGYACHVIAMANTERGGVAGLSACTVKESYQPADIGRLAFGLGHAGMFRRLMFSTWSQDSFYAPLSGSLGIPTRLNTEGLAAHGIYTLAALTKENESKFKTEDAASEQGLAYLIAELVKQGCPAFPQAQAA